MKRIIARAHVGLMCILGLNWLYGAMSIVSSGSLALTPTTVTIDDLLANGVPATGYLEITGGYLVPDSGMPISPVEDREYDIFPYSTQLVTAATLAAMRESNPAGAMIVPGGLGLRVMVDRKHLESIWPECRTNAVPISPSELTPTRITAVGEIDVYGVFSDMHLNHHPNGPWPLLWKLSFVLFFFIGAILLFRRAVFGGIQTEIDGSERPPIYDGEYTVAAAKASEPAGTM